MNWSTSDRRERRERERDCAVEKGSCLKGL